MKKLKFSKMYETFQTGGVRKLTMASGYKSKSKPKEIKADLGKAYYTESLDDTSDKRYSEKSNDVAYQDAQRAKQQELVKKYGMLDDDTLINKFNSKEIDRETGQLLSDAYNRENALKNNQTTYKRKFNTAIGLDANLDYLAGSKFDYKTPDPVQGINTPNEGTKDSTSLKYDVQLKYDTNGKTPSLVTTVYNTDGSVGKQTTHPLGQNMSPQIQSWFNKSPMKRGGQERIEIDNKTARSIFGL